MGKRLSYTPNNKIRSALRKLWLQSRERSAALKRDDYTCQICFRKQSKARGNVIKVEVHHKAGVQNWDEIYRVVRKHLLVNEVHLEVLCKECHGKE